MSNDGKIKQLNNLLEKDVLTSEQLRRAKLYLLFAESDEFADDSEASLIAWLSNNGLIDEPAILDPTTETTDQIVTLDSASVVFRHSLKSLNPSVKTFEIRQSKEIFTAGNNNRKDIYNLLFLLYKDGVIDTQAYSKAMALFDLQPNLKLQTKEDIVHWMIDQNIALISPLVERFKQDKNKKNRRLFYLACSSLMLLISITIAFILFDLYHVENKAPLCNSNEAFHLVSKQLMSEDIITYRRERSTLENLNKLRHVIQTNSDEGSNQLRNCQAEAIFSNRTEYISYTLHQESTDKNSFIATIINRRTPFTMSVVRDTTIEAIKMANHIKDNDILFKNNILVSTDINKDCKTLYGRMISCLVTASYLDRQTGRQLTITYDSPFIKWGGQWQGDRTLSSIVTRKINDARQSIIE